jgi:uncharacterized membrane-anchored protein
MATATITLKKGTTAEWTESKRVLDDGELGLETTVDGHRIIRIGNGSTEFMQLPVTFDIEEVREIKQGMDDDAQTYYNDMVEKGTELLAEMKALATTVELEDDASGIKYRMGISAGTLYFEEVEKETASSDAESEDDE